MLLAPNTRSCPKDPEYTWPLLETVTYELFCLWPTPTSLPLDFQLCQQQTTLRKFMFKLKYPSIMSPNTTEGAVMKSYKVNAEQTCPRWPFIGRTSPVETAVALRRIDSGYGPLCEHRLSSSEPIPSPAAPNNHHSLFWFLRWLLQEKSHLTVSLGIQFLEKSNLGFPVTWHILFIFPN